MKPKQYPQLEPDHRNGHKSEPKLVPVGEHPSAFAGTSELPGGILGTNGNPEARVSQLGDSRLPVIQRQALVKQIGQMQGNHHLQQVFAPFKARTSAEKHGHFIQREGGWLDASKQSAKSSQPDVAPPSGRGWNADETQIISIRRIPVEGLTHGYRDTSDNADASGTTSESAIGKAVVLMPDDFDPNKPTKVILHLHGFGSGYRQLEGKKPDDHAGILKPGQVRDVELYRMEQQLDALHKEQQKKEDKESQLQVIAVLPQGRSRPLTDKDGNIIIDSFGDIPSQPNKYLEEVFSKIKKKPATYQVVLSGHSGGGPKVIRAGNKLKEGQAAGEKNSQVDEIILFDAINGPGELKNVKAFLRDKLDAELAQIQTLLKDKKDDMREAKAIGWIKKSGFRFRGYHTGKSHPQKRDEHNKKMWADAEHKKPILDTSKWEGYGVRYEALEQNIADWFRKNTKGLSEDVREALRNNYQIFEVTNTHHERVMGATRTPSKKEKKEIEKGKKPAPSKAGVLHEALSALDEAP